MEVDELSHFPDGSAVQIRRNSRGELEVKLPVQRDDIDIILTGKSPA
jgi:hypothetical protein